MKKDDVKSDIDDMLDGYGFVLTEEELLLLWCNAETTLKPEYVEQADNILTGKILKALYEKYGGDQAAFHVAREKGWC